MPSNVSRIATFFQKEILRSGAGLDDIPSYVIDSTKIAEYPASSGRYVLEAGTVMVKVQGDAAKKIMPLHSNAAGGSGGAGAYVAADIVGILASTIEFYIGEGVTASGKTDEAVAVFWHGNHFNITKLVGYTGNEAIVAAALSTCKFS